MTPESGYGRTLRAHGLHAEADKMDELILRGRVCDSECGAVHFIAEQWYRAEKEFGLDQDDPYEAIKALREKAAV